MLYRKKGLSEIKIWGKRCIVNRLICNAEGITVTVFDTREKEESYVRVSEEQAHIMASGEQAHTRGGNLKSRSPYRLNI
ncbi:MAG: hypothetical protein ACMUIM_04985 [bacterium]